VTLQIVRDWVLRFNAKGPEGLLTGRAPGAPSRLNGQHRQALEAIVEQGPIPAIHGVVRWRLVDLIQWIWEEFRLSISKQTLSRELRAMSYRKLSARPRHHAKSEVAVAVKRVPHAPGGDRGGPGRRQACRDLVRRRGPGWAEEQDHPPLGQTRHTTFGPKRPENSVGLHLRRNLPGPGQGGRPRPAPLHHRGHGA
jgi:putative transposase